MFSCVVCVAFYCVFLFGALRVFFLCGVLCAGLCCVGVICVIQCGVSCYVCCSLFCCVLRCAGSCSFGLCCVISAEVQKLEFEFVFYLHRTLFSLCENVTS